MRSMMISLGENGLITVLAPKEHPLLDYRHEDETETHLIYYFAHLGVQRFPLPGCKALRYAANNDGDCMPDPRMLPTTRCLIEALRRELLIPGLKASKKMIRGGILEWMAKR